MANCGASTFLLLLCCIWGIVEGFNLEREDVGHSRSKRQLKKICANELYTAPLSTICKTPLFMAQTAAVSKCLATQKMKTLADAEPVCVFDCVYQANKWLSAAGVLDAKKIEADCVKGSDKTWGPLVSAAAKKCAGIAQKQATAKLASGYATKCKTPGYVMQTCMMVELYTGCPAAAKSPMYNTGKMALGACDPVAVFKTPAELAKNAASAAQSAAKGIDPKMLAAAQKDPKMLQALAGGKMPAGLDSKTLQALTGGKMPAGLDLKTLMASKQLPAGFNMAMLG